MPKLNFTFPLSWTATSRARRLLFLGLAAPGFGCVFSTPLHQNLLVLALGLAGFAGAVAFRLMSEASFLTAKAADPRQMLQDLELHHDA